jgi:hypothetical protein
MDLEELIERLGDSVKFRSEMDALVGVWKKRGGEEERAYRLSAVVGIIAGQMVKAQTPGADVQDPRQAALAREQAIRRKVMVKDDARPLTSQEAAALRAEDAGNTPDPVKAMERAFMKYIRGKGIPQPSGYTMYRLPKSDPEVGDFPAYGWERFLQDKGMNTDGMQTRVNDNSFDLHLI